MNIKLGIGVSNNKLQLKKKKKRSEKFRCIAKIPLLIVFENISMNL